MTFSIVAVDKDKGEVGFAIASCCWNSGLVCSADPEVGAIASQASGNLSFLETYFEKLAENLSPEEILSHFKETDKEIESRQIGMITSEGKAVAFTGEKCNYWAGHDTGEDYSCQGNILVGPEVIKSMVEAFKNTKGDLTDRLHAAMIAGDDAGGDTRGKQSARLQVMKKGGGVPGSDVLIDISIGDHPEPIREIGRILNVRRTLMEGSGLFKEHAEAGDKDKAPILHRIEKYMEDKMDCRYLDLWKNLAHIYIDTGDEENAVMAFRKYLEINPSMKNTIKQDAKKGLIPEDIAKAVLKG